MSDPFWDRTDAYAEYRRVVRRRRRKRFVVNAALWATIAFVVWALGWWIVW